MTTIESLYREIFADRSITPEESSSLLSHNSTYSGKRLQNTLSCLLYSKLSPANLRFVATLVSILPVVGLSSSMKEYSPISIVEMLHMGFQVSG